MWNTKSAKCSCNVLRIITLFEPDICKSYVATIFIITMSDYFLAMFAKYCPCIAYETCHKPRTKKKF